MDDSVRDRLTRPSPFEADEYRRRATRIQAGMAAAGLDALLLTTEAPIRHLTGFHTETWASPTRPRFLVVPAKGDPIAVVPTSNRPVMADTWVTDIRTWQAPNPSDEGVSVLADVVAGCVGQGGRVGAELGPESRLGMPQADFVTLVERLAPRRVVDGSAVMTEARRIKSPGEIARVRHMAQIASAAFEALPSVARSGMSEREIGRAMMADMIRRGADKVPFFALESGPGGYDRNITGPGDRTLGPGDLLFIDTGGTYDGYWCDFDRHISFGHTSDAVRRAYDLVYAATDAGIAAARPGATTSEVWRAMSARLASHGQAGSVVGRMGHGLGLLPTEPPSLSERDGTVLEAGMVITIEPSLAYDPGIAGRPSCLMLHEENIVITEAGSELLSRRAPPQIPVVP